MRVAGAAAGEAQHRLQFGLRTAFEADTMRAAETYDLFDDVPLLVHLDRIHADVPTLIPVLRDGGLERVMDVPNTVTKDVLEADQHRQPDAAQLQVIR